MTVRVSEIDEGKTFRWQNDVYRVEKYDLVSGNIIPDIIPVTRLASLWPKESNPWLKEDTWMPINSKQIERFNSHCYVTPVNIKTICEVTPIKE